MLVHEYAPGPVVPPPTDRAAVLREAADLGRELSRQGHSAQEIARKLDRLADEVQQDGADTLPAWLHQRFDPRGPDWDQLDEDNRPHWEPTPALSDAQSAAAASSRPPPKRSGRDRGPV